MMDLCSPIYKNKYQDKDKIYFTLVGIKNTPMKFRVLTILLFTFYSFTFGQSKLNTENRFAEVFEQFDDSLFYKYGEVVFDTLFEGIKNRMGLQFDLNWNSLKRTVTDSISCYSSREDIYSALDYTFYLISRKNYYQQFEASFSQVFEIIENNSIKKHEINWIELKNQVKDSIGLFTENEDVYNAINVVLAAVNDNHSIFIPPEYSEVAISGGIVCDSLIVPKIDRRIINENIGYIEIPGFYSVDSLVKLYALELRKALIELDKSDNLNGWIIDLRNNFGGRLGPDQLALMPLFNDSLVGLAINNKNELISLVCNDSLFKWGDLRLYSLSHESGFNSRNKKVAILISEKTASVGEFLALSSKFQKNTRIFGLETKGKTSHLFTYTFTSGARLLLATHYWCDTNGNIIKNGILPDVECSNEDCVTKAIEWID